MTDLYLTYAAWRVSSRSNGQGGQCVEVGFAVEADVVGVRDSKDRGSGLLAVPGPAWSAFLASVRSGALAG